MTMGEVSHGCPLTTQLRTFDRRPTANAMITEIVLDGSKINSLETFYDEVSANLIPGEWWGRNLDAFDDILYGGFGIPEEEFVIRWAQSGLSKQRLGYRETVRQLQKRLAHCHPTNREKVRADLLRAQDGQGPTVFDWLLEIIGGHENIRLVLG